MMHTKIWRMETCVFKQKCIEPHMKMN